MSIEKARAHFAKWNRQGDVMELEQSSATVELAAAALGCEPARIAKSLTFLNGDSCIMIVTAGDARIDNSKFKSRFQKKAKMLSPEQVKSMVGYGIGGVCPFGINPEVKVFLDESLRRFETVYPACGTGNSAIKLTIPELEEYSVCQGWVDVCKDW